MLIHYIINQGLNGIFHLGSTDLISHYEFFKKLAIHRNFKKIVFKQVFTILSYLEKIICWGAILLFI